MGEARVTSEVRTRRLRARGDDGAALVEFALVFPLLAMLLLGMVTAGFAYNQKLAITNGVREGSRFGATLPVASSVCIWKRHDQLLAEASRRLAHDSRRDAILSRGRTGLGHDRSEHLCRVRERHRLGSDATTKLTRTGTEQFLGRNLLGDNLGGYRRVQVTGSREGKIEFLVASPTLTLSSQAVTKFEAAQVAP